MQIAVPREVRDGETRVAATPDSVKRLVKAGHHVVVETNAGLLASMDDKAYEEAGASIAADFKACVKGADLVIKIRRPEASEIKAMAKGTTICAIMAPFNDRETLDAAAKAGLNVFGMEFVPRISRAQSMDILSSQSNLAGYKAVIDGAASYGSVFPMMMTAAGTVAPAKVFVMGAGVAGLQAIATARRLGAVVTATDVRPAAKEQVESLGAKFIAVEDDEFRAAETSGGYAKEMSDEYKAKQAELVSNHIAKQNMVITTALIPGRPAPKLVTKQQVESMPRGAVVVDLAAEQGGNCELTKCGEVLVHEGKTIIGHENLATRLATDASALFAKNLTAFIELLSDGEQAALHINTEDEIIAGTLLCRDGAVVHPNLQS